MYVCVHVRACPYGCVETGVCPCVCVRMCADSSLGCVVSWELSILTFETGSFIALEHSNSPRQPGQRALPVLVAPAHAATPSF